MGSEMCIRDSTCMVVLRDGIIRAITTSESSCSQLNYKHLEIPGITRWVEDFAKTTSITGQLCFDFIKTDEGAVYPIECNPRIHSQCVTFLDLAEFGDAVLSDDWNKGTLTPLISSKPTFWLYNEVFKVIPTSFFNYGKTSNEHGIFNFLQLVFTGRDSDLDIDDPLPFFMRNHFQMPYLLLDTLMTGKPWLKLDFCIGKVVEINGD